MAEGVSPIREISKITASKVEINPEEELTSSVDSQTGMEKKMQSSKNVRWRPTLSEVQDFKRKKPPSKVSRSQSSLPLPSPPKSVLKPIRRSSSTPNLADFQNVRTPTPAPTRVVEGRGDERSYRKQIQKLFAGLTLRRSRSFDSDVSLRFLKEESGSNRSSSPSIPSGSEAEKYPSLKLRPASKPIPISSGKTISGHSHSVSKTSSQTSSSKNSDEVVPTVSESSIALTAPEQKTSEEGTTPGVSKTTTTRKSVQQTKLSQSEKFSDSTPKPKGESSTKPETKDFIGDAQYTKSSSPNEPDIVELSASESPRASVGPCTSVECLQSLSREDLLQTLRIENTESSSSCCLDCFTSGERRQRFQNSCTNCLRAFRRLFRRSQTRRIGSSSQEPLHERSISRSSSRDSQRNISSSSSQNTLQERKTSNRSLGSTTYGSTRLRSEQQLDEWIFRPKEKKYPPTDPKLSKKH